MKRDEQIFIDFIVYSATKENKCFSRVAHDFFPTGESKNAFSPPVGGQHNALYDPLIGKHIILMR